MRRCRGVAVLVVLGAALAACGRPVPRFSADNARAHVDMLAGTIGSRPIGTPENARARQYIVDQLKLYGFTVRVQDADARRPELGRTAHVSNIIGVLQGQERSAVGLLSHYDSVPEAPGAGDDASGVAISLEAARVLASAGGRRHSLMVLVTDGEEAGLMGAAALVTDREVSGRLAAYVNIEGVGTSGTAELFETGPLNDWIVRPWARRAPHPRGASYALEIYRRLPNDTDFSILARHDIPGLNFAFIDDSYAYHTARDTAERVPTSALLRTGENIVATLQGLDEENLAARSDRVPTFFGVNERTAFSWGPVTSWVLAILALVAGVLAWVRVLAASVRLVGTWRWLIDLVWTLLGVIIVAGALVLTTWALRHTRAVYHPWYAHPTRLFVLLILTGITTGWCAMRVGRWIPARAHAPRHPMIAWSFALPVWIAAAGGMATIAPASGYLWTLPLLIAGAGLLLVPLEVAPVRAVSTVVLGVAGAIWLRDSADLLQFTISIFGRLPLVTPVASYAALMLATGMMIAPPFVAATAAVRPVLRGSIVTAVLLILTAGAAALAYSAPAYTTERPQRRHFRVIVPAGGPAATYEVGSLEPGIDLHESAPRGWTRVSGAPESAVPVAAFPFPFVFRTTAPSPGPPPASIGAFTLTSVAAGTELAITVVPQAPGLTVVFALPAGVAPARSNLPGVEFGGRWRATFVGVPAEGLTWRAAFRAGHEAQLPQALAMVVSHRFPGGAGWQSLPPWLPQDRAVWSQDVAWILAPPIPPVSPLR